MKKPKLQIGMPVILVNAKGMKKYGLYKGQEGMANQLLNVEGQNLVLFMPDNGTRMFYIKEDRVIVNMDKLEEWQAVNGEVSNDSAD